MNKGLIISQFNPNLTREDKRKVLLMSSIEDKQRNQRKYIQELNKSFIEEYSKLKNAIEDVRLKVNTAVFGDRKFINETYSFEVPITKEYFLGTDYSTFKDGILTAKAVKSSKTSAIKIPVSTISSRRNTDFVFTNNTMTIFKNPTYPYQELQINITKVIDSGYLVIELDKFQHVSVLDQYGRELIDRSITKELTIPINKNTKSIVLRFEDNKVKKIKFNKLEINTKEFLLKSTIETKKILINSRLKQIGINTCDNYSDKDINLHYQISINGGPYRSIRPLNKHKNMELESILSIDDSLQFYVLEESFKSDTKLVYTLDHFDSQDIIPIKAFKYKLGSNIADISKGVNTKRPNYTSITLYTEKEYPIFINTGNTIYLNDKEITGKNDLTEVIIPKGFSNLDIKSTLWNQSIDLLKYDVLKIKEDSVADTKIKLKDKKTNEEIEKVIKFKKNDTTSNSLFLQTILNSHVFIDEYKPEIYTINDQRYIVKQEGIDLSYVFVKYNSKQVDTVQIKIDMETANASNPTYITSLTIRGI